MGSWWTHLVYKFNSSNERKVSRVWLSAYCIVIYLFLLQNKKIKKTLLQAHLTEEKQWTFVFWNMFPLHCLFFLALGLKLSACLSPICLSPWNEKLPPSPQNRLLLCFQWDILHMCWLTDILLAICSKSPGLEDSLCLHVWLMTLLIACC